MIKTILKVMAAVSVVLLATYIVIVGIRMGHLAKKVPDIVYAHPANTIIINKGIGDFRMSKTSNRFLDMTVKTKQLSKIVREGADRVFVKINSGGGMMRTGMQFVYLMRDAQQLGVKFTCVVEGTAMSMALIIFTECDERYAVFGSTVMWHSVSMTALQKFNESSVQTLAARLKELNGQAWATTKLYFFPDYFIHHYFKESILSVSEVEHTGIGYLRVIRAIKIQELPANKGE